MSATVAPASKAPAKTTERAELRKLPAGWRIIAAKEFADHVVSVRFLIVLVVLGLAAAIPLYFASDEIRNAAQSATSVPAVFLLLFTIGPQDINILRVDAFVGIVAPLLGLTFAFDAVNSERSEGTLPRLLSQPIYRDDVINGKFLAGLGVIGIVLVSVVVLIAGFGMFRLGIVPHGPEVPRLIAWVAATFLYVALWLSFGLLLSVVIQRAATAALVGFGVWLLLTIFGQLIVTLVSGIFTPASNATVEQQLGSVQAQEWVARILPGTLYQEITTVILHPNVSQISAPATVGQLVQSQYQIPPQYNPGVFSLDQSLLLVWPQLVVLVALTVACFAAAYILFMRQEVRA
jgi:ABC-2 type transport system permease protein